MLADLDLLCRRAYRDFRHRSPAEGAAMLEKSEALIRAEVEAGELLPAAASEDPRIRGIQQLMEDLCHHPAAARAACPTVYVAKPSSEFMRNCVSLMAAMVITEQSVILGSASPEVFSEREMRSLLAHELAHIVNGDLTPEGSASHFNVKRNQQQERQADKKAAELLDYQVEPFIAALQKFADKGLSMKYENPCFCRYLSDHLFEKAVWRSHPANWARIHYLRQEAARHGVCDKAFGR